MAGASVAGASVAGASAIRVTVAVSLLPETLPISLFSTTVPETDALAVKSTFSPTAVPITLKRMLMEKPSEEGFMVVSSLMSAVTLEPLSPTK